MALGVHGGVSTTLTYFVVQLSAAVASFSASSPLPRFLVPSPLYIPRVPLPPRFRRPGWNCDCNSNYLISTIASLYFDSRHTDLVLMRAEGWEGPKGVADETEENCSRMELNVHGIAGRTVTQFKSRGICWNGTMALSESNITCNSYNAFLVLLRFSFILFFLRTARAFNTRCIWKVGRCCSRRLTVFIGRLRGLCDGRKKNIEREELIMPFNYMWVLLQFLILYTLWQKKKRKDFVNSAWWKCYIIFLRFCA